MFIFAACSQTDSMNLVRLTASKAVNPQDFLPVSHAVPDITGFGILHAGIPFLHGELCLQSHFSF